MIEELNPIQKNLLEIFKWFDAFCRQNELRYYAIGGTLLGTLRHKGFIPWDDDLDVGMPRKDYELFMKLMNGRQGRYQYETIYSTEKDFCYSMGKLYDTRTTLVEQRRRTVKRGLYIDIFPIDGLCNKKEEAKNAYSPIKWRLVYHEAMVTCTREGRNFWKNAFIQCTHLLPEFLFSSRDLRIKIDNMCAVHDFDLYQYGGNLLGTKFDGEVVPLKWFGKAKEADFEDMKVFIPEDSVSYLQHIYGNWEELPPNEKQVTAHDFVSCDLNKSYVDLSNN